MSSRGHDHSPHEGLWANLVHPPFADRRFWLVQTLVVAALVVKFGADLAQDRGVIPTPGFVWMLLLFVPLVYAGTTFGLAGSLAVALEGIALFAPEELLVSHTTTELWGAWSISAMVLVTAVLLGDRFEKDRAFRAQLLAAERLRTVSYYEGHPLFGEHLLAMLPDGVALVDDHGGICYANAPLETLAGYGPGELIGKPVEVLVPLGAREAHVGERATFAQSPKTRAMGADLRFALLRRDGSELPVNIALAPYSLEDKPWVVVTVRDDTARRTAEDARIETERRFELAFTNNVAGMLVMDLDDRALAVNDSFCEMLGRTSKEILGRTLTPVMFPEDQAIAADSTARMLVGGLSRVSHTRRYLHKDGRVVWAEVSRALVRDEAGEPQYFIVSVRDITDERSLRAQLSHQALHDRLTGLANRTLFEQRLPQALARTAREGRWLAVLLVDLDEFQGVNDTYGHQVGDDLLVAVARRLEKATRPGDTLCRFGSDEFLYLGEALASPGEAEEMAERILRLFDEPFLLAGENLDQRASIGLEVCSGTEGGVDLVRDADTALYDAKRRGKGRYALFRPEMHDRVSARFGLLQDLRRSFESGEISMHYQPIVDLATSEAVGVEALMRWKHPGRGWVPPDVFIPLAEQSDLIFDLGSYALHQAVTDAASWRRLDHRARHAYVTVNLSPRQFHDPDLLARIEEVLGTSGLEPGHLALEITESTAFVDVDSAARVAARLRHLGIALAIDDFGTGYSSLSYFTLLRPRILKIDRSFVSQAQDSPDDERLLEAMVSIGHSLNTTVLAEGIETTAQLETLRRLGCELGQGYLFSPAVPVAELAGALSSVPASRGADPPPGNMGGVPAGNDHPSDPARTAGPALPPQMTGSACLEGDQGGLVLE